MLPVGKGRHFMANAPRLLDALVGGWNLAGTMTYHAGTLLNFGGMLVSGDPHIQSGTERLVQYFRIQATARVYPAHQPLVLLRHPGTEVF